MVMLQQEKLKYTNERKDTPSTAALSSLSVSFSSVTSDSEVERKRQQPSIARWTVPIIGVLFAVVACLSMAKKTQTKIEYGGYRSGFGSDVHLELLPAPDSPEYNEQEALDHVFYSKVAFCTEEAITSWSCGTMCENAPIMGTDKIRYIPEGQQFRVQGYVAQIPTNHRPVPANVSDFDFDFNDPSINDEMNGDADDDDDVRCMISFRGSLNAANWYADFLAMLRPWPLNDLAGAKWCRGCKAHYGFTEAYDELRTDVHEAVADLNCTRLLLAGHSLGGAIATIASFDLRAAMGYHVEATWTFGKPRIGNAEFANSFDAAAAAQGVSPPIWRVVHYHDPIPRAPPHLPRIHPVVHGGLEIYYTDRASSEYTVCPQQGAMENTSESCMAGWPLFLSLNADHIDYLNESFAFKNFPDECKTTE